MPVTVCSISGVLISIPFSVMSLCRQNWSFCCHITSQKHVQFAVCYYTQLFFSIPDFQISASSWIAVDYFFPKIYSLAFFPSWISCYCCLNIFPASLGHFVWFFSPNKCPSLSLNPPAGKIQGKGNFVRIAFQRFSLWKSTHCRHASSRLGMM